MLSKKTLIVLILTLLFFTATAIILPGRHEGASIMTAELSTNEKRVLVIDPGHGGLDGGAVSPTGQTESEVNLSIALKMREIARLLGTEPILTRTSEELDYPDENASIHEKKVWDQKTRVARIKSAENAVLISVHQNMFPDPRPSGTEVLYGKAAGSDSFAALTQENLVKHLCPENRRVAAPISEKIYLMKNVHCPAILAECGFLSNPEEAKKLESDVYRTELALILISSYFQYIS